MANIWHACLPPSCAHTLFFDEWIYFPKPTERLTWPTNSTVSSCWWYAWKECGSLWTFVLLVLWLHYIHTVLFKMVVILSEKPICTPPCLSEVSPLLPLKQFQCSSDWRWPSLKSHPFKQDHLALSLSMPPLGDWWCDVLGLVSTGNVSKLLNIADFLRSKPLVRPVYLLGHFSSPQGQHLYN